MDNCCSVKMCERPHKGLGFCDMHYQRFKKKGTPGNQPARIKHGYTKTPTYTSWQEMRRRCKDPRRNRAYIYISKNIQVCERWDSSFLNFLQDMGERPEGTSLDRIDNDGNYEPGNCRWATHSEQSRNRTFKNKTGYLGVTEQNGNFVAQIWDNKVHIRLGGFDTPQEAAVAYLKAKEDIENGRKPKIVRRCRTKNS